MAKNLIKVKPILHKGQNRFALIYSYDTAINNIVKQMDGRFWSKSLNCWHLPITASEKELKQKLSSYKVLFITTSHQQNKRLNAKLLIDKSENKIQLSLNNDEGIKEALSQIDKNYRLDNYAKWFFAGTNENYLKIIEVLNLYKYDYKIEKKKIQTNCKTIRLLSIMCKQ